MRKLGFGLVVVTILLVIALVILVPPEHNMVHRIKLSRTKAPPTKLNTDYGMTHIGIVTSGNTIPTSKGGFELLVHPRVKVLRSRDLCNYRVKLEVYEDANHREKPLHVWIEKGGTTSHVTPLDRIEKYNHPLPPGDYFVRVVLEFRDLPRGANDPTPRYWRPAAVASTSIIVQP